MANADQILELVRAGFSKDEILSFFESSESVNESEDANTVNGEPEHDVETQEKPESEYETRFSAIESAINNLTNVIQKNNILLATKDSEIKKVTPEEAADAAIKKFFGGK